MELLKTIQAYEKLVIFTQSLLQGTLPALHATDLGDAFKNTTGNYIFLIIVKF